MSKIYEDGHAIITYDEALKDIYLVELSCYLQGKYTSKDCANVERTKEILNDAFQFLVNRFREIIHQETDLSFFSYVFLLHEESIKLYFKTLDGYNFIHVADNEFALYRRILKLILEEGCDIDLNWGTSSLREATRIEEVINHLIYIATLMYDMSDRLANCKMIEDCYTLEFKNGLFYISYKHHYALVFNVLPTIFEGQYEAAVCDVNAAQELVDILHDCFGFHFSEFKDLIRTIQSHHNPSHPNIQTIEPYVLPDNLAQWFNKDQELMEYFCNGLTISRDNKPTIETAIYKPTDEYRYIFRPILVYNIKGVQRELIGENKINETLHVLTTNALHWEGLPKEWLQVAELKTFMDQKSNSHESTYKNKVKELIKETDAFSDYNIEILLKRNSQNISIVKNPGEIDCIIIIPKYKRIIVGDIKYNRSRFEAVGWQKDYANFTNKHELKLKKKTDWVRDNLDLLQEHIEVKFGLKDISLNGYSVEGCFLINTPTFYMFNGDFRAITIMELPKFFDGWLGHEIIDSSNRNIRITHPYFRVDAKN